MITRRALITNLSLFVAAPAIVRASYIMPVKAWAPRSPFGLRPFTPIVIRIPGDYLTIAEAIAHANPGDSIVISDFPHDRIAYESADAFLSRTVGL